MFAIGVHCFEWNPSKIEPGNEAVGYSGFSDSSGALGASNEFSCNRRQFFGFGVVTHWLGWCFQGLRIGGLVRKGSERGSSCEGLPASFCGIGSGAGGKGSKPSGSFSPLLVADLKNDWTACSVRTMP